MHLKPETGTTRENQAGQMQKSGCKKNYKDAAYIWNMTGKRMITIKEYWLICIFRVETYQSFPGGEGVGHGQPDLAQPAPRQYAHQGTATG